MTDGWRQIAADAAFLNGRADQLLRESERFGKELGEWLGTEPAESANRFFQEEEIDRQFEDLSIQ